MIKVSALNPETLGTPQGTYSRAMRVQASEFLFIAGMAASAADMAEASADIADMGDSLCGHASMASRYKPPVYGTDCPASYSGPHKIGKITATSSAVTLANWPFAGQIDEKTRGKSRSAPCHWPTKTRNLHEYMF